MKILIADDSGAVRERIKLLLSDIEDVEMIGEARNVGQAMEQIRQLIPDVIILDIRMPDGSGMDVLRHIRKRGGLPVVIMLTSYPHPQYRKRCMEAGADFFFDKTEEFEKVAEAVSGSLKQPGCDAAIF